MSEYAVAIGGIFLVSDEGILPLFGTPAIAQSFIRKRLPRDVRPRVVIVPLGVSELSRLADFNELAKSDYRGVCNGERLSFTVWVDDKGR